MELADLSKLVGCILCILIALFALLLSVFFAFGDVDSAQERFVRLRYAAATVAAFICVACTTAAAKLYLYLAVHSIYFLIGFFVWYGIGYGARFIVHIRRHEVLSPVFKAETDELFFSLFWALFGPIEILRLIRERQKPRRHPLE